MQKVLGTVGVSVETLRRGEHADLLSPYRPWTDTEKKLIADKIRYFYNLFLATVENGRKVRGITVARADELGRGKCGAGRRRWRWVWSIAAADSAPRSITRSA